MQANPSAPLSFDLESLFPKHQFSLWREAAETALKGADFEKQLYTQTLEGLRLQPLYTAQDLPESLLPHAPAEGDHRRGPAQPGWLISQDAYPGQTDNEDFAQQLAHGLESLELNLSNQSDLSISEEILKASELGLFVEALPADQQRLQAQFGRTPRTAPGGVLSDPVSLYLKGQLESVTYASVATAMQGSDSFALQVSGLPFHEAGAHAAQELAYTLGSLVEGIQALSEAGLSVEQILSQTRLVLGVGPRFFMEVAKMRACRVLVARLAEIYQQPSAQPLLHARTSRLWLTRYDPYANYLRQTIGACAAVVGNVDSLCVGGFSESMGIPDAFAQRQARNLQLLLKHEVHLDQWLDPAGGSYFIESLTTQLADAAWSLFQELESQGGLLQALSQGLPQAAIAETAAQRLKQIEQRRQVLVGTNTYANPQEHLQDIHIQGLWPEQDSTRPHGLAPLRLAEDFESLRQGQEQSPKKVTLLCLGQTPDYLARSEFARGFFEVAACQVVNSPALADAEALASFVAETESDIWVLCSSDAAYVESLNDWAAIVKKASSGPLVLAGRMPQGVNGDALDASIYMGCNALETLEQILSV